MSLSQSFYIKKYFKYKNKYLELKGGTKYSLTDLLIGNIPIPEIQNFINENKIVNDLNKKYIFEWNTISPLAGNTVFENRVFDAIINYDFINSAGIIVTYNSEKIIPSKQNGIAQLTQDYEPILKNILLGFSSIVDINDLLTRKGNYPYNKLYEYSIFSLFSNDYFDIILDLLQFGLLEADINYLYCSICKKIFTSPKYNNDFKLDQIIKFLLLQYKDGNLKNKFTRFGKNDYEDKLHKFLPNKGIQFFNRLFNPSDNIYNMSNDLEIAYENHNNSGGFKTSINDFFFDMFLQRIIKLSGDEIDKIRNYSNTYSLKYIDLLASRYEPESYKIVLCNLKELHELLI